ncbi:efflux RND transporter periplasmic adaptor subunit [Pseudoxanthomonas winnipegensis]|uniref:efflux RND transporter periplasmic adaptor subunit n=1 Tax=Pseudoxanthomonas winnipegensis TaxID=2480810 RepID=UPI0030F3BB95
MNTHSRLPRCLLLFGTLLLAACGKDATPAVATDDHAQTAAPDEHADTPQGAREDAEADSTVIPADIAREAGIRVAPAGPGTIADAHEVQGVLTPVDGRIAQATARFPGPVRSLRANVGDRVRAGQALASIESNLSLTSYTVSAPIGGVITARSAQLGGVVGEGAALFEIADLSTLWVDLHVFGSDTQHITAGVPVTVTRMTDGVSTRTTLERVLPGTATASQSTVARALLRNDDGLWRPGAAVKARIVVATTPAALVVPLAALQTLEGRQVVFVREGQDRYVARAVELGQRDATQAAVLSGLKPGEHVVVEQSYVVKADLGKAGAGHAH